MVFTRGINMNLRSKTTVRQGAAKETILQRVLRKKVASPKKDSPSSEPEQLPSGTTSKKRPGASASAIPIKKNRWDDGKPPSLSLIGGTSSKRISVDSDVRSEGRSETTNSEIGDASKVVLARVIDDGVKYEVNGYVFRRDSSTTSNAVGLRCVVNSRKLVCRMRATAYPRNYCGGRKEPAAKYREISPNDPRVVLILSNNSDQHNHPPPSPKRPAGSAKKTQNFGAANRKKIEKLQISSEENQEGIDEGDESGEGEQDAGSENEEEKSEDEDDSGSDTEEKILSSSGDGRGRRRTKERAAQAWAWLKKNDRQYVAEEHRKQQTAKLLKKKKQIAINRSITAPASMPVGLPKKSASGKTMRLANVAAIRKDGKKSLSRLQSGNASARPPASMNCRPSAEISTASTISKATIASAKRSLGALQKLKKNAYLRFHAQKLQRPAMGFSVSSGPPTKKARLESEHSRCSVSSLPALDESGVSMDESAFIYEVTVDGKFYIMDGFAYEKERDRKGNLGFILRCVDRLNCKARAITTWKSGKIGGMKSLFGRHIAGSAHSHDRSAPGLGIDNLDDTFQSIDYMKLVGTSSSAKTEAVQFFGDELPVDSGVYAMPKRDEDARSGSSISVMAMEETRRRKPMLPIKIDLRQMRSNYDHVINEIVGLQMGANIDKYPALIRVKEATGGEVMEYLTDEDMLESSEEFGVDSKTISLLNQQFKQYRAFYDLFALSLEEFGRFIDAYEKWLTPGTAEMWWNNGDMMEFLSRRILRSEKLRDTYVSAMVRSQGSTRLDKLDRPILPLPEPEFLHCQSTSVRCEQMRDSLHGIKAMKEALQGDKSGMVETVKTLMREFDEMADNFFEHFHQSDNRIAVEGGTKLTRMRAKKAATLENSQQQNHNVDSHSPDEFFKLPEPSTSHGRQKKAGPEPFILKPTKKELRDVYFKYIYCLNRICKLQTDAKKALPAFQTVKYYLDNEHSPLYDLKAYTYYRGLKDYRAVCDFLALAPAHAINVVGWFQKWKTPPNTAETWKNGFVFEYICRLILRHYRYKDMYKQAVEESMATENMATVSRMPLLPFGEAEFLEGPKSILSRKKMRSLALHRFVAEMKHMGLGESKVQKMLQETEDAAKTFFKYLGHNKAWPLNASLQLYLSPENNLVQKTDDNVNDDIFDRLHQELQVLDSLCSNKTAAQGSNSISAAESTQKVTSTKSNKGRPRRVEKHPGKFVKGRNGKKSIETKTPAKTPAMSPTYLLHNMEEKYDTIQKTFEEVTELRAFAGPVFEMSIGLTAFMPSTKPRSRSLSLFSMPFKKSIDRYKDLNARDRHTARILDELAHLEAVLTLDDLAKAVINSQFDHPSLGTIVIRNGRLVKCGQNEGDAVTEFGNRRVTLGVGQLPKCVPLKKISYDDGKRTLLLNGVAVELRVK